MVKGQRQSVRLLPRKLRRRAVERTDRTASAQPRGVQCGRQGFPDRRRVHIVQSRSAQRDGPVGTVEIFVQREGLRTVGNSSGTFPELEQVFIGIDALQDVSELHENSSRSGRPIGWMERPRISLTKVCTLV